MKHNRVINTLDTMIYVETQFGEKTTSNMLPLSQSSEVMPYERPTLLKVTTHTIKCDPVKGFQSPY